MIFGTNKDLKIRFPHLSSYAKTIGFISKNIRLDFFALGPLSIQLHISY